MERILAQDRHISQHELSGIRHAILRDVLLGRIDPELVLPVLQSGPYQVLLLRPCAAGQTMDISEFAGRLQFAGHAEFIMDLFPVGNDLAMLLCNQGFIKKFEEFSSQRGQESSQINLALRFPEPMFLAYGRICQDAKDISLSYQDAQSLMQQSFFFPQDQHLLRREDLRHREDAPNVISNLLLEKYTQQLLQSLQAYNRTLTYASLSELETLIAESADTPEAIRLFFTDLYLCVKEQIRYLYPGNTFSFYTNTHIIKTIMQTPRLSDITCFLAQRFDMIMSCIGASSQESVLGSILHYIHHNYTSNITLESIAPLFGYNHSYLGKIFRKKTGVSFNEYIDRLRITRAKELLLQGSTKIYSISKQVGYNNVDYFHIKFRKYVSMSPLEFRKANQMPSNSPDEENSEKSSLFRDA